MEENRSASQSGTSGKRPEPKFLETAAIASGSDTAPSRTPGSPAAAAAWIGRTLGKYEVIGVLGQGGMGVVFRGRDALIERDVAIKLLPEDLAEDETALARFLAEAKAAGKLNHANVVSIYEIGQEGRAYFLVMELIPGGSVADGLDLAHPRSLLDATRIAIDACKGLSAAHAVGLIHRDMKPANLMKTADGSVKITDFGLAKTTTARAREMTQAGMVVGTPYFMSPEQCDAKPVDVRSDIYSLGATYYSLLTGRNPYENSSSVIQVMFGHCQGEIPDPRSIDTSVPTACSAIVARAMAKSPADRYQSAGEMLADLQAVAATLSGATRIELPSQSGTRPAVSSAAMPRIKTPGKQNRRLWIGAGLGAAVLLLIALAVWRPWQSSREAASDSGAPAGPFSAGGAGAASALGTVDAKGPTSGPSASLETARGVTSAEIVLGMSAPFNGPAQELGRGMQVGLETFFEDVNQRGGIAGRKIRLVALDDGYEPDRARANMEELFDKHKVFAVIGNVGTPTAEKALPYALEKQMLFFGAFTGAKLLRKDPPDRFVFNYRASYEEETAAIVKYFVEIKKIRPEQIAVFAQQDGYGDAGYSGVVKMIRKLGGDPDKLLRVGYVRNTIDVADAAAKIVQAGDLRAVIMVPTYRPAARFIQLVRDAGKDPIFASVSFVGSNALADELTQLGSKYSDGIIVTQVVPHRDSQASAVSRYRELLGKYHPNEKPGFVSLEGYIDAMIFAHALELAGGSLTTDSLIAALESIHNLDLGIGAPITFGPSEHQGAHKVWGTVLDSKGQYQILDLD
ncbi:MAG TPA: ABC transporter substrate-binding protein [Pirellulales bacterium]|jgi:serine/threonine protein kinase/ABC-type branched-subunit amino acid transport system substrate-binding protein|nr:ABC transporter substrate-binding protein [Pirellulales bacterium]